MKDNDWTAEGQERAALDDWWTNTSVPPSDAAKLDKLVNGVVSRRRRTSALWIGVAALAAAVVGVVAVGFDSEPLAEPTPHVVGNTPVPGPSVPGSVPGVAPTPEVIPIALGGDSTESNVIRLALNGVGVLFLDGEPATLDVVKRRVSELEAAKTKLEAVLVADTETPHSKVVAVMDALRLMGVKDIGIRAAHSGEVLPDGVLRVIRDAIMSARVKDAEAGWKQFSDLLHSREHAIAGRIRSWRRFNYPAFRRKVELYLERGDFRVVRSVWHKNGSVKVFVHNRRSMPTPCDLAKDPKSKGAWRIVQCSL